jgi:hypothetical protein
MINRYFVRPIEIVTPVTAAGYGDTLNLDYDNGTTATVKGWFDQLTETESQTPTRDVQEVTGIVFLPHGTPIDTDARVKVDGSTFQVLGPPKVAWTPRGAHHIEVSVRYVDG